MPSEVNKIGLYANRDLSIKYKVKGNNKSHLEEEGSIYARYWSSSQKQQDGDMNDASIRVEITIG